MKLNLKTKPIDYTGCDPLIEEELRRGNAVYCRVWRVWDDGEAAGVGPIEKDWVVGYRPSTLYRFITPSSAYNYAVPLENQTETRVKSADKIMAILLDEGYEPDSDGDWNCEDKETFNSEMWFYCGKIPDNWNWESQWLEEVEVEL